MIRTVFDTRTGRADVPRHIVSLDDLSKHQRSVMVLKSLADKVGFYNLVKSIVEDNRKKSGWMLTSETYKYRNPLDIYNEMTMDCLDLSNEITKYTLMHKLYAITGYHGYTTKALENILHSIYDESPLKWRTWFEFDHIEGNHEPEKVLIPTHFTMSELRNHFETDPRLAKTISTYSDINYAYRNFQVSHLLLLAKKVVDAGVVVELSSKVEYHIDRFVWVSDLDGDTCSPVEKTIEYAHHGWVVNRCFEYMYTKNAPIRMGIDAMDQDKPIITADNWEDIVLVLLGQDWLDEYKTKTMLDRIISNTSTEIHD